MDAKNGTEEFIRRESKPVLTESELQLETKGAEPEFEEIEQELQEREVETEVKPETQAELEFTRTTARTEFDAIHPRFRVPKKQEVIEEFQSANDYYCEQCKLYFAPDILALTTHFKRDMVKHQPIDECFYCKGPVYAYTFNKERQIYHNCEDANLEVTTRQKQILIKDCPCPNT